MPEPNWEKAACRGSDENLWFDPSREELSRALDYCRKCPIMQACRDYAAEHNIRHGVWGGRRMGGKEGVQWEDRVMAARNMWEAGYSARRIAAELDVSEQTVDTYLWKT